MMSVVHPAYHCGPNGGHGSFLPSASRRLSCVLVLATVASSGRTVSSAFVPHPILPDSYHMFTATPSTGCGTAWIGGWSLCLGMKVHGRRDGRGVHSAGYVIAINRNQSVS